jgi:hypothetical protein
VGAELIHSDKQMDAWTGKMKVTVAFRSFANVPMMYLDVLK